jgi:hypothetical protein
MPTHQDDDDLVMVSVPRSKLGAVYIALGAAYAALADPTVEQAPPVRAEETVEVYGQGPWTAPEVSRLEHELKGLPDISALLTRLAEQAPDELTFNEAADATDVEPRLLKARLGSLSKITKRLFGVTCWPMSVRYVEGGGAIYSMDPKIAEWWLAATGQTP